MRRRAFITLFGGAAAWPLAARAQQTKIPTIGFLGTTTSAAWGPWTTVFMQRLRELGWIDGQNVAIVVRWAEGRSERFAELTAEFVRLNVNVIFTGGTPAIAAKQATSFIPIVFSVSERSGWHWTGRKSGATGRQHHRTVHTGHRYCWYKGSSCWAKFFLLSADYRS